MRKNAASFLLVFLLMPVAPASVGAQETDADYDSGIAEGITIYGRRPADARVMELINGSRADRKRFIETEFLEESGFKKAANARYRKTETSEKALSVLHGFGSLISFGLIPVLPFDEIEYDRLPDGEVYKFEAVFVRSNYRDVLPEVLTVIEIEYMLQIEFFNGVIIHDNLKYYTDENINKFEKLILGLPDYPESVSRAKKRYTDELRRIKRAFERHRNPNENYIIALRNLGG